MPESCALRAHLSYCFWFSVRAFAGPWRFKNFDYLDSYHRRASRRVYSSRWARFLRSLEWVWGFFDEFPSAFCSRCGHDGQSDHSIARIAGTSRDGQESGTSPAIAAGRAQKKNPHSPACAVAKSIRKSSICFPDLSCADNQRGLFPRPAQVSDGSAGFLYFA